MRCINLLVSVMALVACVAAPAQTPTYNLGKTPSAEEIKAWDIAAIGPAGKELPPGSGTAKEGATIYAQQCALCHGRTGTEEGQGIMNRPALVGGKGEGSSLHPVPTGMKYRYPYTEMWGYINRAMPFYAPGSLRADQVYALTALLLYWNGVIRETDVIDAKSLPKIQMPKRTRGNVKAGEAGEE